MNNTKTWNELVESGDVVELTEEQIAIGKSRLQPIENGTGWTKLQWKPRTPEQDSDVLHANEKRMRRK